jgi:hypothetical protein
VRGNLLGPLHRRVRRVRPAYWIVVVSTVSAQLVDHREQKRYGFLYAISGSPDFVCCTLQGSLGAGAVISHHEDDKSIVPLPRLLYGIEQAADMIIGVRQSARVDLHHPAVGAFLVRRQGVPRWDLFRPLGQLGTGRNDAELDLPGQRLLANFVPALVELAFLFRDPVFGRVMGRMGGTGRTVEQRRLARRERMLHPHPGDRLVREVAVEDLGRVAEIRLDRVGAVIQRRVPLVAVAAKKPVEMLDAATSEVVPSSSSRHSMPLFPFRDLALTVLSELFSLTSPSGGE